MKVDWPDTSASVQHPMVSFTVALPVYNEEGIIEHLHALLTEACAEVGDSYEILYVNDGSYDGTSDILQRLAVRDPHVSVAVVSWASVVTSTAFFSSVIMLGQAFICEYLARVYEEVRHRPGYSRAS